MSYKIVYADYTDFNRQYNDSDLRKMLEIKVKSLIDQGWSCVGGVVPIFTNNTLSLYQTMIFGTIKN